MRIRLLCLHYYDGKWNRGSFGTVNDVLVLVITQFLERRFCLVLLTSADEKERVNSISLDSAKSMVFCSIKHASCGRECHSVKRCFHAERKRWKVRWVWMWCESSEPSSKRQMWEYLQNAHLSDSLFGASHSEDAHSLQTWAEREKTKVLKECLFLTPATVVTEYQ